MAKTVGELKKLLEGYPDDMAITYLDDEGIYHNSVDFITVRTLGRFFHLSNPDNIYYRESRFLTQEEHVEDVEALVLG